HLAQAFCTAQATTRATGQAATSFLEVGEGFSEDIHVQCDSLWCFFNFYVEYFGTFFNDPFGKAEAKSEVLEVGGRCQHHGVSDTVVLKSNRHFLSHSVHTGRHSGAGHGKLHLWHHAVPASAKS